jgi:hypothetical protein
MWGLAAPVPAMLGSWSFRSFDKEIPEWRILLR